jgi:hypothetical protein
MFKFEKGDHVSFVYGSVFSPNAYGAYQAVVNGGKVIARKSCGSSGGPEYRVAGFSGWWAEENLVLVSRGTKNSPSCDEAGGPTKDQPVEPKCDTEDSGKAREEAEWIVSYLDGEKNFVCSHCGYYALYDISEQSFDSHFCPHCGKLMVNSTEPWTERCK